MSLPREGSRTTREGILVSTAMDWCRVDGKPIPFRVVARQQCGANTAGSVRLTGQAAYVSGSLIPSCQGDEAGVGGGVVSGTRGGVCEPKTFSSTVRFEGRGAVRHDDAWWMNNRNTWGKLTYLGDLEEYPRNKEGGEGGGIVFDSPAPGAHPAPGTRDGIRQEAFLEPIIEPLVQPTIRPLPPSFPVPIAPDSRLEQPLAEHLRPILPAPDPTAKPAPAPTPRPDEGLRISARCARERICFNRNGYDAREYDRQLQMQQDAINAKSAQQNVTDIDGYRPEMRETAEPFQIKARYKYEYDNKTDFIAAYDEAKWDEHMSSLAAIHRLDMVVGGDPTDVAGMGNTNINSAIGSSWVNPKNPSRKDQLRNYAAEMAENGCPMQVELSTCERMIL